MINKTIKIYVDCPLEPTNDWKEFNSMFDKVQVDTRKAATHIITLCNIYNSYKINDGVFSADQWVKNTFNKDKLLDVLYHDMRASCPHLCSLNSASFSKELYDLYFKGDNSYKNKIEDMSGNPPMAFTEKLPIKLVKNHAYVERSDDKNSRIFKFTFPFLSLRGKKELLKNKTSGTGQLVFTSKVDKYYRYPILENIVNGTYKLCGSKIQRKEKRRITKEDRARENIYQYIVLLTYSEPKKQNNLDKKRIMGVDIGCKIPAMCAVNFNDYYQSAFGGDSIIQEVIKLQKKESKAKSNLTYNGRDGHGRKAKIGNWDDKHHKVSNKQKTVNQKIASDVVRQAIRWKCGIIHLEDLTSIKNYTSDKFLSHWNYFELQDQIINKAMENGISVKKINPYLTSQTCSVCGNTDYRNRPKEEKGQAYFKCTKCGFEANADFNAARNIATSTNYSKKKKSKKMKEAENAA